MNSEPVNAYYQGSLVLYKDHPARIMHLRDKLEIEVLGTHKKLRVRPKDVMLLHPGPVGSSEMPATPAGEIEVAWEILSGRTTSLEELAELIYGIFSPATAWATWQVVSEGIYFEGVPERIVVHEEQEVLQKVKARETLAAEKQAWKAFLDRVRSRQVASDDGRYLKDVGALALGQHTKSRVLRALGRAENPENAHSLLLSLGVWDHSRNPYPCRFGVITTPPTLKILAPPEEERIDLTHLAAYAIDDEDAETPDDALSLEGDRLWVHIADVAASILPDSATDLDARGRGASLYLPERIIPMLHESAISAYGLGMGQVSTALSFGLDFGTDGQIIGVEIAPSMVRVARHTYSEIESRLDEEPFNRLYHMARLYEARRRSDGGVFIELPEAKVSVRENEVFVTPIVPQRSRLLVREAMIMTGEAVAAFAVKRGIPLPFATQESLEVKDWPESLSGMYACMRSLRPRQYRGEPRRHAGLGLSAYVQVTSPLRRYLDLVAHQQLRAYLRGDKLMGIQEMLERVGSAEAVVGSLRRVDSRSRKHWILAYLQQHGKWDGIGVLVDKRGHNGTALLPALALQTQIHLPVDVPLDSSLHISLTSVNLPHLEAHFMITE